MYIGRDELGLKAEVKVRILIYKDGRMRLFMALPACNSRIRPPYWKCNVPRHSYSITDDWLSFFILPACLSVYTYMYARLPTYLLDYLYVPLPAYLYAGKQMSVCMLACACLYVCLFVCLPACLIVCLHDCLPACLLVCLPAYLYDCLHV